MPEIHPNIAALNAACVQLEAGTHWWCTCGLSGHQPLCDGSHKGSGFAPVKFTLEKSGTVWLCNCKHTKTPPYCDGSHGRLATQTITSDPEA